MSSPDAWTLPLAIDSAGALGGAEHASSAERLRLVLDVVPGERPLLPEFGCGIHHMSSIESDLERQLAAALVEEALDRWAPWARVERVDVTHVSGERITLVISTATEKMELECERATVSK